MADPILTGLGLRVKLAGLPGFTARRLGGTLPFYFQAPPLDQFEFTGGYNYSDYTTVAAGQFSQPQARMLRTLSFETIFTDAKYSWTFLRQRNYTPNPLNHVRRLPLIAESGTPIRLTAGQPNLWGVNDLDMAVTLREVRPMEKAHEIDARYVSLSFVEFRHPSLHLSGAKRPGKKLPVTLRVSTLPVGRKNLYALAKYYYGSASMWKRIAKANGIKNVSATRNLSDLYRKQPNKKLTIPTKPAPVRKKK